MLFVINTTKCVESDSHVPTKAERPAQGSHARRLDLHSVTSNRKEGPPARSGQSRAAPSLGRKRDVVALRLTASVHGTKVQDHRPFAHPLNTVWNVGMHGMCHNAHELASELAVACCACCLFLFLQTLYELVGLLLRNFL